MFNSSLFSADALAARAVPEQLDAPLVVSTPNERLFARLLLVSLCVALIWGVIGSLPRSFWEEQDISLLADEPQQIHIVVPTARVNDVRVGQEANLLRVGGQVGLPVKAQVVAVNELGGVEENLSRIHLSIQDGQDWIYEDESARIYIPQGGEMPILKLVAFFTRQIPRP